MIVTDIIGDAGGHESLSPTASTGITTTLYKNSSNLQARGALITVEDNSIRFTIDGTTPTNTNGTSADTGHKMDAGQNITLRDYAAITAFRCIDAVSASASAVKVTVYY